MPRSGAFETWRVEARIDRQRSRTFTAHSPPGTPAPPAAAQAAAAPAPAPPAPAAATHAAAAVPVDTQRLLERMRALEQYNEALQAQNQLLVASANALARQVGHLE